MVASWPPDSSSGDLSQPPGKTFADVLLSSQQNSASADLGSLGVHRGEPALLLSKQDLVRLAEPYKNALIGRFALKRPSMDVIRKFFTSLGLKGACSVWLLDAKHVLIRPALDEDYSRLFVRRTWFIHSFPMTLSKWTVDFNVN